MKIRTFRNKVWLVRNAWLTSKCCYPMAELPSAADRPPPRQEQGTKGPPSALESSAGKGNTSWRCLCSRSKGCRPREDTGTGNTCSLEIRRDWKYPADPTRRGSPERSRARGRPASGPPVRALTLQLSVSSPSSQKLTGANPGR